MENNRLANFKNEVHRNIIGLIKTYDIGFVLDNLESVIILPAAVKIAYTSEDIYVSNKKIMQDTLLLARSTNESFGRELTDRNQLFSCIRQTNPRFATDISRSMSNEEYETYVAMLKHCVKKINDLIFKIDNYHCDDYSEMLLTQKDLVSDIVDTEAATKISILEDEFILKELDSLDYANITPELQEEINNLRKQLEERLTKNREFYTLYSKPNCIQLKEER